MKLLRVHVISADTCGGLLDGLDISFRLKNYEYYKFDPLCLIGPNGTGKSQLLQVVTEIFQSIFHACVPREERLEGNPDLQFEIEYLIKPPGEEKPVHMMISRQRVSKGSPKLTMVQKNNQGWIERDIASPDVLTLLPSKIIGYTSGENETISLPFLVSRSGYAEDVREAAFDEEKQGFEIPDTRLMLIDYGTNLEVIVSNLLTNQPENLEAILYEANLDDIYSFRCVIQLAHSAVPKLPKNRKGSSNRKGIQLTDELEDYLDKLHRCSTCYSYDEKTERYIFDFLVNDQTKKAFRFFWQNSLNLYSSFHKFAMLNDLAIPRQTRNRFKQDTLARRFAASLPEPQDEEKVFRFEQVLFRAEKNGKVVDYVSLSDGEHQLVQILGIFSMLSTPDILFLLDEPESHLNPQWRAKFISRLMQLPTSGGIRGQEDEDLGATQQDCLLTTHAPFIPSDMQRNKVFIFSKNDNKVLVRHPEVETYGTTFDTILEECFDVQPPISKASYGEIEELMQSENPEEIKEGMNRLGHSVEKIFLQDRIDQLTKKKKLL